MSKIAGEINAEMMHPKVIHEQRKALFAEMVRKTGSQQSVLDRLLQEIQFLRDHEGGPMDEEVIDILRGKVAELEAENTLHKSAMDNLAAKLTEAERQRDERVTGFNLTVAAVEADDRIEQIESERDELLACLNLIYSWANNWDSEFMNDPDWKNTDYPRIQAAIAKVSKP